MSLAESLLRRFRKDEPPGKLSSGDHSDEIFESLKKTKRKFYVSKLRSIVTESVC